MTNKTNGGESYTYSLGRLYRGFGYSRYKMSKFEEYDTYVQNKDFLISDRVITFTDVSGKLLAMKPDVTISIIKNTEDTNKGVRKMYYKENVYRVSDGSHGFKEIMQTGLECIGDIDTYSISEVIMLACKSLEMASDEYVLDISHMGFVSGLLAEAGFNHSEKNAVLCAIGEKNLPELKALCAKKELSKDLEDKITGLVNIYGKATDVICKLKEISVNAETQKALEELTLMCDVFKNTTAADKISIDFSVVNDMNYYNGIVFRGYIEGIPTGVLSGGQYDKLMEKMGKSSKAVGFAIYLDLLEMLDTTAAEFDTDVLVIYNDSTSPEKVYALAEKYTNDGKTVLCVKNAPGNIRCKETICLNGEGDIA